MAKSRKPQGFVDPLDSVFGVIFGQTKSKPVKIKPRKINGKNTTEMLVGGLAEIAARPANYVSDGILGALKEAGNVNLMEFNLDQIEDSITGGDSGNTRVRIRGSEVASFLTNPNKFIDSVFEKAKAERKWATYLNLGRGMDVALMTAWAKKNGFSSKEAITMGMASSNFLGADQINEARRKFSESVVLSSVRKRGELVGDPKFIDRDTARAVAKALSDAKSFDLKREPGKLASVLRSVPGLASRPDFNDLVTDISTEYSKNISNKNGYGGLIQGSYISDGKINRAGYINAIQQNYSNRMALLNTNDPREKAEYIKLSEAYNALDILNRLKGPNFDKKNANDTMEMLGETLKSIKKDIPNTSDPAKKAWLQQQVNELTKGINDVQKKQGFLKFILPWGDTISGEYTRYKKAMMTEVDYELQKAKWALSSATSPDDIAEKAMHLELWTKKKKALNTASGIEWRLLLSDIEGTANSINGNIIQGGLGANIANGTFFLRQATGNMAPGTAGGVEYLKGRNQVFGANLVLPRSDISDGYAALTHLYYLTPGSLAKTVFFNGEGFGYLKYMQRLRIANSLNDKGVGNSLFSTLGSMDADSKKALEKFFKMGADGITHEINKEAFAGNYITFMETMGANSSNLGGMWADLEKLYSKDQRSFLTGIMRISGAPQRMVKEFDMLYQKTVKNRVNAFFVNNVVSKFFGKEASAKIMEIGITKLGIRQMISIAVSEWLAGVGVAVGGPIGGLAAFVLTQLAEGFIDKLIRPFLKLFMGFLWAFVICLLALVAWLCIFLYSASHPRPQQHIPPTDALECANGNPFADIYDYQKDPDSNLPDPDPNSSCPIHSKSMICTQGDEAGSSSYHQQRNSMDIGATGLDSPIWYAPTDGRIVSFTATNYCSDGKNYGGAMVFVDNSGTEYHILHVQALASGAVSKGKPVAIIQTNLSSGYCWTGAHFHLDVKVKGSFVDDTQHWYQEKLKCNVQTYDGTCR